MADLRWIAKTAAISLAVGAVAGLAAERFISWKRERDYEGALDEYAPWEDCEEDWPDIPDGVNEVEEDGNEPEGHETAPESVYRKPDLSSLVDYTKYSRKDGEGGAPETDDLPGIEFISQDEFVKRTGNLDGYVSVTGTWFAQDGILAGWDDELDEKDPATTVGEKAVEMFEDPDVDAVYVCNHILKVLFEVVRSEDSYELAMQEALVLEAADPAFTDEG